MQLIGPKFPNVGYEGNQIFTKSSFRDFNEDLLVRDGVQWRPWQARRSKLGAAIVKNISQIGLKEGDTVLYLGAAHGYTPSFMADMIGPNGSIFCLDFSANVVRDLLKRCKARENMIPLLADASKPDSFSARVTGCDVLFQDIAQRDQVGIFLRNMERFVKPGGFGLLSLKARSVDMTKHPKIVFKEAYAQLERFGKVVDYRELDPFEKDHALFVVKKNE